ncbi:hypothetical protein HYU19_01155 [Candidatus Woesearchaeota archaeon]|nr:hypothetical protein [Candidatus Woesearchaeota archaeon]
MLTKRSSAIPLLNWAVLLRSVRVYYPTVYRVSMHWLENSGTAFGSSTAQWEIRDRAIWK